MAPPEANARVVEHQFLSIINFSPCPRAPGRAILRFTVKKQIPINDRDGSAVSVRALAASAGIQFGSLQAEVYRLRDKLGPDRKKGYDESIRRMARGGAVSETEQRALLELGKRGFAVGSDAEFEKFLRYVRALHQRMLLDPKASPVALAIVGVIGNYAVPSPTKPGRRGRILARKKSEHPVRDILLGVAGGALGGLSMSGWNPLGGVVGGVVGGIIAGIKALC
jgi:hypothetical protein